jgi:hypothetical protein
MAAFEPGPETESQPAPDEHGRVPSWATLEIELAGVQGTLCKRCKKKFVDPGEDEIVKECPHCHYRFYANLTYQLRGVEAREQRREQHRRRRGISPRVRTPKRRSLVETLDAVYGRQCLKRSGRPAKSDPAVREQTPANSRRASLRLLLDVCRRIPLLRRIAAL